MVDHGGARPLLFLLKQLHGCGPLIEVSHNLSASKYYTKFIYDRDTALERLLINSRLRQADMMNRSFTQVLDRINHRYPELSILDPTSISRLDEDIDRIFKALTVSLWLEIGELRKKTYMLSNVGEAQAISGAVNAIPKFKVDPYTLNDITREDFIGGSVLEVIAHNLNSIRRKIITKVEEQLLTDQPVEFALYYAFKQFPRMKAPPSKPPLKKVKPREANTKPKFSIKSPEGSDSVVLTQGEFTPFVWDQVTWDKLLEDYSKDYIPVDRSPAAVYSLKDPLTQDKIKYEDGIYAWEVEKEVTHDFVSQVRAGQIAAANDKGIKDFVVITVLDDRTCETCCDGWGCADFDGMKVSEIEKMTKNKYSAPPYHFNCRCTLAPVIEGEDQITGDLSNMSDWVAEKKDFDTWLNS